MNQEDLGRIGEIVYLAAEEIFIACGSPDDFCIQHVSLNVVFGGLNRVIFDGHNWSASKSHCTENFYWNFQKLKDGGFK